MPRQIRAAVCRAFGAPLGLETLTLRDPGPGEIEVRLEAVAICHSDISYLEGAWGGALPAVYGHEAAGRITALGPETGGLALGDRVLVTLIRACGSCPDCAGGRPVYCGGKPATAPKLTDTAGHVVEAAMDCGAFADHVLVHRSQIAPLGETIAPHCACLLACGVPTGVGAVVNTAGVRPGEIVVVIGAGGVGLNAIQGARIAGAARIVAMDLEPSKLEDAMAFGATDTIAATDPKPWRKLLQITGGRLAAHVFVTVGAIPAYDVAPRLLAPGGTAYAVGMPHSGARASYEPVILAALGQGLRGTKMGDVVLARDIPWMVDLHAQSRLKLDELVSRTWRFEQINDAIADTKAGQARRNVLTFPP
ncbi:alcohol dehydrogenase catalytic domain-containing protein [Roseicyclus marinus]|uniref:alcohol dehydrogenase catalytic domain-containing protein n=1 Tax=Roseicyclus marinus TaxID=2161673 RepID=UPI00240F5D0E|nr:alcohol dehydrogenase catalytic domain-containing protein [Roseicyclus marinus]MDG3042846.1 alcohol dehydrogenase catalytic domain-containing protein [Roseicyclus marinus]